LDKSDYYLEMASWEKLKYTTELHKLNLEMGEHLCSSLEWIIHYCQKHDILIPNMNRIQEIISKIHVIEESKPYLDFANRKFTGRRSTDDYTEPIMIMFISKSN